MMAVEFEVSEEFAAAVKFEAWYSTSISLLSSVSEDPHATGSAVSSGGPITVVENDASWEQKTSPCRCSCITELSKRDPGA